MQESIIQCCLEMHTTLRLMRIGWHFSGNESLGMASVQQMGCPWDGTKPVPRMVQNQLDHRLELNMVNLDKKILKEAGKILQRKERGKWLIAILAFFIILHIREIDAARNIYWRRYNDSVWSLFARLTSKHGLTILGWILDASMEAYRHYRRSHCIVQFLAIAFSLHAWSQAIGHELGQSEIKRFSRQRFQVHRLHKVASDVRGQAK